MKVMRVFLNPNGADYLDIGAGRDDFNMPTFWNFARQDGCMLSERAVVPLTSIHHVLVLDVETAPNLTVFTGGKPN